MSVANGSPVRINQTRNFKPELAVWNEDGSRGPAWDALVSRVEELQQNLPFQVGGAQLTARQVVDRYCGSREQAEAALPSIGLCWQDLCAELDTFAATDQGQLQPDMAAIAQLLGIDTIPGLNLQKGATITIAAVGGAQVSAEVEAPKTIGTDLLQRSEDWRSGRDRQRRGRTESEGGVDFRHTRKNEERAIEAFKETMTSFGAVHPTTINWADPNAAELMMAYHMPVCTELQEDGGVQLNKELFVELHLKVDGAEYRVRLRIDPAKDANGQKIPGQWELRRELVQWKTENDGATGSVQTGFEKEVTKTECRFDNPTTLTTAQLNARMQALVEVAQTGIYPGTESSVGAVVDLVQYLKDTGRIVDGQRVHFEPTFYVLQERQRSHLWLRDPNSTGSYDDKPTTSTRGVLTSLIDHLKPLAEAHPALKALLADEAKLKATLVDPKTLEPIPGAVEGLLAQVGSGANAAELTRLLPVVQKMFIQYDEQVKVTSIVGKHSSKPMYWYFDYQITSLDPWTAWNAAARTNAPSPVPLDRRGDDKDTLGALGDGLHVEVEWDATSSMPFEDARQQIAAKLKQAPTNAQLLEEQAFLERMIGKFKEDKMTTLSRLSESIVAKGVEVLPELKSKDQRGNEMYEAGPVYGLS